MKKLSASLGGFLLVLASLFPSLVPATANAQETAPAFCYTFTKNLGEGKPLSSADAQALTIALSNAGVWPQESPITTYNDTVASAVSGFQEKYAAQILTPNGLQYGTGYVGASTRAELNSLYGGCSTSAQPVQSTGCPAGFTCTPINQNPTPAPVCPPGYNCAPIGTPTSPTYPINPTYPTNPSQPNGITVTTFVGTSPVAVTATTLANVSGNTGVTFPISFTVTAGASAAYIPANPGSAVQVSGTPGLTVTPVSISSATTVAGDTNTGLGTNSSGAFVIPAYSNRTFTIDINISNINNSTPVSNAIIQLLGIYFSPNLSLAPLPVYQFSYSVQTPGVSLLGNPANGVSSNSAIPPISLALDPSSPISGQTTQTLSVPVLTFDLTSQGATQALLTGLNVNLSTSGLGNVTHAYLYQNNSQIAGASVQNGIAQFNLLGVFLSQNTPYSFIVKVDTANASNLAVTASINPTSVSAHIGAGIINVIGSATGYPITVTGSSNATITSSVGSSPVATTATTQSNITGNVAVTWPFTFTATSGASPVYISANPGRAVAITSDLGGMASAQTQPVSITSPTSVSGDTNTGLGTSASGAFYIPSNSSRTFTVNIMDSNAGNTVTDSSAIVALTGIYYATTPAATNSTATESLYTLPSALQSPISALLSH